jgi:SET domain-containing protein
MKETVGVRELHSRSAPELFIATNCSVIRERDSLDLEKNDIVLSRFQLFPSLVESGDAELV